MDLKDYGPVGIVDATPATVKFKITRPRR